MLKQTWKLDQKLNLVTKMMRDVGLTALFVTDQTFRQKSDALMVLHNDTKKGHLKKRVHATHAPLRCLSQDEAQISRATNKFVAFQT